MKKVTLEIHYDGFAINASDDNGDLMRHYIDQECVHEELPKAMIKLLQMVAPGTQLEVEEVC